MKSTSSIASTFQDLALIRDSYKLVRSSENLGMFPLRDAQIFKRFETLRKVAEPSSISRDVRCKSSRPSISGLIDHIYPSYPFSPPLFLSLSFFFSPFFVRDASAARAHKACSEHFRRGGTRPFHQDIRYAMCPLRAPSPQPRRNTPRPGGDDDRL